MSPAPPSLDLTVVLDLPRGAELFVVGEAPPALAADLAARGVSVRPGRYDPARRLPGIERVLVVLGRGGDLTTTRRRLDAGGYEVVQTLLLLPGAEDPSRAIDLSSARPLLVHEERLRMPVSRRGAIAYRMLLAALRMSPARLIPAFGTRLLGGSIVLVARRSGL